MSGTETIWDSLSPIPPLKNEFVLSQNKYLKSRQKKTIALLYIAEDPIHSSSKIFIEKYLRPR